MTSPRLELGHPWPAPRRLQKLTESKGRIVLQSLRTRVSFFPCLFWGRNARPCVQWKYGVATVVPGSRQPHTDVLRPSRTSLAPNALARRGRTKKSSYLEEGNLAFDRPFKGHAGSVFLGRSSADKKLDARRPSAAAPPVSHAVETPPTQPSTAERILLAFCSQRHIGT
jgi:hypothetical protein